MILKLSNLIMFVHICSEEYPSDNPLNLIMENHGSKSKVKFKDFELINLIDSTTFKYHNFYIHLVKSYESKGQPFPDYLVYESKSECKPLSTDIPHSVYEVTKNIDKESGNMCYQRLEKFVYLRYIFGKLAENIKLNMIYDTLFESDNKSITLNISNRMCATLGITSILFYHGKKNIFNEDKYKTLEELCSHINSTKGCGAVQNNRCYYRDGSMFISSNLRHSKKKENSSIHDPNTGFVCALIATAKKIDPNIIITLEKHNIPEKKINSKAKLWTCLDYWKNSIKIENYKDKKWDLKEHNNYIRYNNLGEKISSILLQYYIEKNNLGTIIFHNHAGCERSYLEYNGIIEKGLKKNLPDLIVKIGNIIFCIEAEQNGNRNIIKGIKQLENFSDFISDMKKKLELNENIIFKKFVITAGGIKHSENPKVLFSILKNGDICNKCEFLKLPII